MSGPLSFSRMTAALATVHNENSASLATANFDFTLVKVEAPMEFGALGATISRKRKVEAEEGSLHRTARKLGALFKKRLPPTEALFRAYGTRVSEISSIPSINPRPGSDREGIFASHIGADTTSIWAAVTSGSAAIAAHLLACMLARVFTGPEAISAWVELVEKQKEWIRNAKGNALFADEHDAAQSATQQEISRIDLSKWDASARAWLQSADQAKVLQHKQAMLILNNASLPVNNEPQTYSSIMAAWVAALEAMNNLVKGLPQRVQNGAALLAISSWHLYPDMAVYGGASVEVRQNDPLFERAALLTLGLQHVREDAKSVYWSLPLAYLQYYGHPVHASRSMGRENARVTYRQFAYIVLGCLFARWDAFAATNDQGLRWIDRFGTILELELSTQHLSMAATDISWLVHLFAVAREFFDSDESEKRVANQLMNLGRRRSTFLQPTSGNTIPIFGLSSIERLLELVEGEDERVTLLRKFASHSKLNPSQFLIRYQPRNIALGAEYASLLPLRRSSPKRMRDGGLKESDLRPQHARWIVLSATQLALSRQCNADFRDIPRACDTLQTLAGRYREQFPQARNMDAPDGFRFLQSTEVDDLERMIQIARRITEIEETGELCLPALASENHTKLTFSKELDFMDAFIDLLQKIESGTTAVQSTRATHFAGNLNAALCSITPPAPTILHLGILPLTPKFVENVFNTSRLNKPWLSTYLSYSHHRSPSRLDRELSIQMENLRAYAMMAEIYQLLPGATICTLVVGQSLSDAKWTLEGSKTLSPHLTLSQAFACIAMFESGTCNISPHALSEVFAMSSGNSLYVAGSLLCDPFERPGRAEIRRVVGNIGRAGISFLISPPEVKIREPDPEKWMAINHEKFNGELEDHFQRTSVHLSFTQYEIPLVTENDRHAIDYGVVLIETLVSIYDGGDWIGEVDILKTLRSPLVQRVRSSHHEQHFIQQVQGKQKMSYKEALLETPELAAISVENWDELLEAPQTGLIAVRAHKNWLARLAISAVCIKHGFMLLILPPDVCWMCCSDVFRGEESDRWKQREALIC